MEIKPNIKFQEEYSAKLPALTLLTNLGWSFISPEKALAARDGKADEVVLRKELRAELQKRTFTKTLSAIGKIHRQPDCRGMQPGLERRASHCQ